MDDFSREMSADVPAVFAPCITRNKIYALHSVRVYITGIYILNIKQNNDSIMERIYAMRREMTVISVVNLSIFDVYVYNRYIIKIDSFFIFM